MLNKAVYKAWGPKPIIIKWIYTAIVRPRITYCAIAWSHTLRYTTRKITINKLNRLAATMITPVRRSTPIKALEILYDIIPQNLHCQYEALASLEQNQEVIKLKWRGESQKSSHLCALGACMHAAYPWEEAASLGCCRWLSTK